MKIAVLGGGHGCYAAAADLSDAGHDVRLWRRDAAALAPVQSGGIRMKDQRGPREARIALASGDIGAVLRGVELVLIPSPAVAQDDIARAMSSHLVDGQVVFLPPGTFGSFTMDRIVRAAGNQAEVTYAETGTLPWLTRKHGAAEVAITMRAIHLPTGVYPQLRSAHALAVIGQAFPGVIEDCGDALSGALMNAGPDHPPAADPDERRALAALRALGHPQRRHAAGGACRHHRARCRAHCHPRGAGLRRAAFPAGRPLRQRPLDVR